MAVCDGLKDPPDAIGEVWTHATASGRTPRETDPTDSLTLRYRTASRSCARGSIVVSWAAGSWFSSRQPSLTRSGLTLSATR